MSDRTSLPGVRMWMVVPGLALLAIGAELLVRGASHLAVALGLSPLAVGLTVVAFGTSSPELAASLGSASAGLAEVAVGSNIFNALVVAGLGLFVLGARWLVDGAVLIAQGFGASDAVIGITVVAVGTSVPEVATSLVASLRGHRDIAVGNAIGSNVFNIVGVLGVVALVAPGGLEVPAVMLRFDLPVMVAVALACTPLFIRGGHLERGQGGLFFAAYVAYLTDLSLAELHHPAQATFRMAGLMVLVPVLFATLGTAIWRRLRGHIA